MGFKLSEEQKTCVDTLQTCLSLEHFGHNSGFVTLEVVMTEICTLHCTKGFRGGHVACHFE